MKYCRWIIALVVAVSLSAVFLGCATSGPQAPPQTQDYSRVKGYMIKLGELKAGSFETPPYIPTKIKFELELQLREKKLLATEGDARALTVNILSSTRYSSFRPTSSSHYNDLTSTVEVVDTSRPEIIAKATIVSYNGWGELSSDFTEFDHVKDIVKFLERIVR